MPIPTDILDGLVRSMELTEAYINKYAFSNRADSQITEKGDSLDGIREAQAREMALRALESGGKTMRLITEARARIFDGGYGLCLDCEEEIAIKRLQILPWAERCVKCQGKHEKAT